jgi:uncharacterized protein (DUF302 family)
MNDISYGFSKELGTIEFQEALERTQEALKSEGFGVLTSIDVQGAMKEKLEVDFKPYTILGACNPSFAHKALQEEDLIGLLLPCNVVVQQQDNDIVSISIADPKAMFRLVDNPALASVAEEVEKRLRRVLQAV